MFYSLIRARLKGLVIRINKELFNATFYCRLFAEHEIKVRVNPYKNYLVGNKRDEFIHVFTHIMQGRTTLQKAELSKAIVTKLTQLFPHIDNIAMNVSDFEKATYCNKSQL